MYTNLKGKLGEDCSRFSFCFLDLSSNNYVVCIKCGTSQLKSMFLVNTVDFAWQVPHFMQKNSNFAWVWKYDNTNIRNYLYRFPIKILREVSQDLSKLDLKDFIDFMKRATLAMMSNTSCASLRAGSAGEGDGRTPYGTALVSAICSSPSRSGTCHERFDSKCFFQPICCSSMP